MAPSSVVEPASQLSRPARMLDSGTDGSQGRGVVSRLGEKFSGNLDYRFASLYATLYRMEDRGWIKGRWIEKAGQRRRCHYRITEAGRKVLTEQRADWQRFVTALGLVAGVKYA